MKTCKAKGCNVKFSPISSLQQACSLKCAIKLTTAQKKEKAATTRKEIKRRKEALKPYSWWVKKAQITCNKFIRTRDDKEVCISCGRMHKGQWHAGHYMSAGSTPWLRFHPFNINKQCSACNEHLSGNIVNYRVNLIKKIGLKNVEWLENNRNGYTPTVDELKEIEAYYKELIKC